MQIAWVGLSSICFNKWITREELLERGFEKMVNEYDGKMAAEQKVQGGHELPILSWMDGWMDGWMCGCVDVQVYNLVSLTIFSLRIRWGNRLVH
jgi:hypothetical protein